MGDTYTHGHHASVLRSHTWRTAENSAGYLLPHLRSGQRLLDVGCGPGTITLDLAQRVAPGEVIGLDASADVIAQAEATRVERGVEGVRFAVGDAYALDLDDGSVDVVHAHQVLQHLSDPVAALREWRRVLGPGGVLAARDSDYASFFWAPADPLLDRWLDAVPPAHRAQRRRGRRRPVPARVGAAGRVRRRHRDQQHLDLRRPRGTDVVGRPVGRPRARVELRRPGPRGGPVGPGRARGDRGGVPPVGGGARRRSSRSPAARSSPSAEPAASTARSPIPVLVHALAARRDQVHQNRDGLVLVHALTARRDRGAPERGMSEVWQVCSGKSSAARCSSSAVQSVGSTSGSTTNFEAPTSTICSMTTFSPSMPSGTMVPGSMSGRRRAMNDASTSGRGPSR